MTLNPDDKRPGLAGADERTREWLEREGFRRIAEAYAASRTATPSSTPTHSATPAPQSVVAFLKDRSGKRIEGLATGLGVDAGFLTDISDHVPLVPQRARAEPSPLA